MRDVRGEAAGVVNSEIARASRQGSARLRGVRALARESGISHVTLLKALRLAVDDGRLVARPGSGMWLTGSQQTPPTSESDRVAGPKWERVASAIRRDVLCGQYRVGVPLPSVKDLLAAHGVSRPTLRRALLQLQHEGLVRQERTKLLMAGMTLQRQHSAVVVCAASDNLGNVQLTTARTFPLLQELKSECFRAGIELRLQPFERRFQFRPNVDNAPAMLAAQGDRRDVLGGVILSTNLPDRTLSGALAWFAEAGQPVAILDEGGDQGSQLARRPGVHYLSMSASALCGRLVGRFLLAMGHRQVAFLSPYQNVLWSGNRLLGLKEVWAQAGLLHGVQAYESALDQAAQTAGNAASSRLLHGLEELLSAHRHAPGMDQDTFAALSSALADDVNNRLERQRVRAAVLPLCRQALAGPRVTAWVACNDVVGLEALAFLRRQGTKGSEEQLSVVGFDDSLEAYEAKLTSYNFNTQAVARSMMNHILRPRHRRAALGAGPWEIEGYVNARASTCTRQRRCGGRLVTMPRAALDGPA